MEGEVERHEVKLVMLMTIAKRERRLNKPMTELASAMSIDKSEGTDGRAEVGGTGACNAE